MLEILRHSSNNDNTTEKNILFPIIFETCRLDSKARLVTTSMNMK